MKFKLLNILSLFLCMSSLSIAGEKNNDVSFEKNNDVSFYTGTFDLIDKEGDDQTNLFGIEHKNSNLFRETLLGKFSPISGAFMTCLLYTSPSPRDGLLSRMPSSA